MRLVFRGLGCSEQCLEINDLCLGETFLTTTHIWQREGCSVITSAILSRAEVNEKCMHGSGAMHIKKADLWNRLSCFSGYV